MTYHLGFASKHFSKENKKGNYVEQQHQPCWQLLYTSTQAMSMEGLSISPAVLCSRFQFAHA